MFPSWSNFKEKIKCSFKNAPLEKSESSTLKKKWLSRRIVVYNQALEKLGYKVNPELQFWFSNFSVLDLQTIVLKTKVELPSKTWKKKKNLRNNENFPFNILKCSYEKPHENMRTFALKLQASYVSFHFCLLLTNKHCVKYAKIRVLSTRISRYFFLVFLYYILVLMT